MDVKIRCSTCRHQTMDVFRDFAYGTCGLATGAKFTHRNRSGCKNWEMSDDIKQRKYQEYLDNKKHNSNTNK